MAKVEPKIAKPVVAAAKDASQETRGEKNHHSVFVKEVVAGQRHIRPEQHQGGRNPKIEV